MRIFSILVLLSLGIAALHALNNPICNYKMFPVFAGGSKEEYVYTLEIDTISNQIFVGGKTQSSNFAPAENEHGFVYSLDQNGNWMWGQFFYNVSYAVSEVDGITLSSKKNYLSILGKANSKPIIMNLNKNDGQILKFITIEPVATSTTTPTY